MLRENTVMSSPEAASVLVRLKTETRDHHNQIEKVPCLKRLFAEDYDLSEYRNLLISIYGFYSVIEPIIYPLLTPEMQLTFVSRSKLPLLSADLLQLGLDVQQLAAIPKWKTVRFVSNTAECLGVWYVLEGSTLGGQVISRQLVKRFGHAADNFLSFYQGYKDETRTYWQAFCDLLTTSLPAEDEVKVSQAVNAAKLTFIYLSEWMDQKAMRVPNLAHTRGQ